jgi:predicted amidophosphoribosyltransferase
MRLNVSRISITLSLEEFLSGSAIIIDDLVTTGATIRESVRALRAAGIAVAGAVTACFAEPLR